MAKELEKDIQRAICDYLAYKGYFFWRQNNTPIFDPGKGGGFRAMPKYSMKGIPDIILIREGKAIFLEVKTKTGVLSDNQMVFNKKAILAGADYFIVRSIEDVQKIGL